MFWIQKEENMHIEELALQMRQRAMEIEASEDQEAKALKLERQKRLQAMQQLYYNAGRWAGGARDSVAKEAFQRVSLAK